MKASNFWQNIKLYRWKSVFFRYFFSLFLIILIVLVPYNVLLFNYNTAILSNEISAHSTTNALKSKSIFDLLTSSFYNNYNLACDTDFTKKFLMETASAEVQHKSIILQSFVRSLVTSSEFVDDIYIYSFQNNHFVSSVGITPATKENTSPWLKTYRATKLPFVMFPRKINSDTFNYLFICSEMYDSQNNVIGVFCTRIKYSDFTDIINKSFEEQPEKIFIVSDIGLILYSDDPALINTLMFEREDIYTTFMSARALEGNTLTFEDSIISVAKSNNSQLMLMSYYSNNFLMRNYSYISRMIVFGTASILAISVIIALFISLKQYRSITQVIQTLEDPRKLGGNKDLLTEFFYITNTISNISNKNQLISNELTEKVQSLKSAQMTALQAQINPHFLFNTLQLINLSIIKEMKSDTTSTKLISELCDLLRVSYDTNNYVTTVANELANLKKYLYIQQARYKQRLEVIYDIDEGCSAYSTLKLLLQPFVENSIVHGFKGKTADWMITIRCYQTTNFVVYELSDNGCGMSIAQVNQINSDLKRNQNSGGRVGISNANQRLKLLYGNQSSIIFSSKPDKETTVFISHKAE